MPLPSRIVSYLDRPVLVLLITVDLGLYILMILADQLFGIVVSTSDCHPRGPGFYSRLYPRNLGSGTGSTQPHEDNWIST